MKIPRVPAEALVPRSALPRPAVGATLPPAAPGPSPEAGPRPLDTAAALRIFVEEVRLAVIEQLGASRTALPEPLPGEGPAQAAARLVRFLQAAAAEAAASGKPVSTELLARALGTGSGRALAAAGQGAGGSPGLAAAIHEARAQAGRALPAAVRLPAVADRAPRMLVEQVRMAIEERLGMLPAAATAASEVETPAQALAALARLFREAAADPVLAVRASPHALRQALELAAERASGALAAGSAAAPEPTTVLADLRTLAARLLSPSAPAPPAPADIASALPSLVAEVRSALAEAGMPPVPQAEGDPPAEAARAVQVIVRTLAQAAQALPAADPRASRGVAEATIDAALRRAVLLLPPAKRDVAAQLGEVRAQVVRMLVEMEAAGQRLAVAAHWSRPAIEVSSALLRGQEPPFRFDLAIVRPSRPPRRRRDGGGNLDTVEPIETTDPEEDEPEPRDRQAPSG